MTLSGERLQELQAIAQQLRVDVVSMVHAAKCGHPGGPLGMADFMTVLFMEHLNLNTENLNDLGRDRFVPFLAVGEDRVDVEDDAAEVVIAVAHDVADGKTAAHLARRIDHASGLRREKGRSVHMCNIGPARGADKQAEKMFPFFVI